MNRQRNIQILRILACFGVFLVHFGQQLEFHGILRIFTDMGAMGVYLFFLLSGYLSFVSFDRKGEGGLLQYYARRLARILPVYYVVIIYQFILHVYILCDVPVDDTHLGWFRYVFLINTTIPASDVFWTNLNLTWTIPAFMLFYLFAPLLYKYVRNFNTALIVWLLSCFFTYIPNIYAPDYAPIKYMQFFLFGIVIYYIQAEKKEDQLIILLVIYLLYFLFIIYTTGNLQINIWTMIFGLILIGSSNLVIKRDALCHIIDVLDEYSFSVYLIHGIAIGNVGIWRKVTQYEQWRLQAGVLIILQTIMGVILVHNIIEKPVYSFIKKHTESLGRVNCASDELNNKINK